MPIDTGYQDSVISYVKEHRWLYKDGRTMPCDQSGYQEVIKDCESYCKRLSRIDRSSWALGNHNVLLEATYDGSGKSYLRRSANGCMSLKGRTQSLE